MVSFNSGLLVESFHSSLFVVIFYSGLLAVSFHSILLAVLAFICGLIYNYTGCLGLCLMWFTLINL